MIPTLAGAGGFSVQRRRPVGSAADEPGRTDGVGSGLGARMDGAAAGPSGTRAPAGRSAKHSLLWRLSVIDLSVLLVIVLLLALTPVTIHAPLKPVEAVILLAGFVVLGTANLLLLRRAVDPLHQLSTVMQSVDPTDPGTRVDVAHMPDAELVMLGESFNTMLDRLELERRRSALRALSAQEAERLRVARELHDEIGQTLTAIAIEAERNAEMDDARDADSWKRAAALAQQSVEDLRRIARRLRPEALDDLGLINAFIALCNRISEHGEIEIRRRLPDRLPAHPPEVDLVVYRVAQEALTNVIRHAGATYAEVSLERDGNCLRLTVRDDGRGMRVNGAGTGRNGLAGMRERALLVGGALTLESEPGKGTLVTLEVPVTYE
jgi:two-component system, NarL family, sensor histidine kinase UhpB